MELALENNKVEFFSSIKELPFTRFNDFNRFVMMDAEIGGTIQDFDKVVIRINEFLVKDLKEEATKELLNLRLIVNNILNGTNYRGLAFACLIKKMNGKEVHDVSSDNLNKILTTLSGSGMTIGNVTDKVDELKKK
tara:strand:+ start:4566 stop:4973 length:408 start_codon:yes stop_codon:yes gene_type:complete